MRQNFPSMPNGQSLSTGLGRDCWVVPILRASENERAGARIWREFRWSGRMAFRGLVPSTDVTGGHLKVDGLAVSVEYLRFE